MVQKPTTGSGSTFPSWEDDSWRGNEPPDRTPKPQQEPPNYETPDALHPHLDNNDVWLYQRQLEALIMRNVPENMNRRFILMLRVLGARARIAYRLEKENGYFIGMPDV